MGIKNTTGKIAVNGFSIYHEIHRPPGSKGWLVFLHEGLGSVKKWREFPLRLAEAAGMNALVYDRRGYGESTPYDFTGDTEYLDREAEFLKTLLEKLEISSPVIYGHSDGGTIALLFAAMFPDYPRAVITEAAHVIVEEISLEGIREAMKLYETTDFRERLEKYLGRNTDTAFRAWSGNWLTPEFRRIDYYPKLKTVECPVFSFQGEFDQYGTEEQLKRIKDAVQNCRTSLIQEARHLPHREKPGDVLNLSKEFILNLK
jgi:pimeloyl-ACP methyl ester carboxylesterase